ncbi:MAG: hypothetical protein PHE06_08880 [Lachnospiraceae bacterium]|nr:hypothetical protein [Lachnospiraceae bacterium]MDD3796062.1 hypothetical protein [Lachnospiraceae bacterium]
MKKFMCRCGLWIIILGLAAGIFCLFWNMRSDDMSENGTLVKNLCERGKNCMNM